MDNARDRPPDLLVGAMLRRLKREAEPRKLDELASFLTRLGPDETVLLRHLAGFDFADEATLRRLDPAGDLLNEQARSSGLTSSIGLPALLRRDERGTGTCARPPAHT
jgi:hypothetical protein